MIQNIISIHASFILNSSSGKVDPSPGVYLLCAALWYRQPKTRGASRVFVIRGGRVRHRCAENQPEDTPALLAGCDTFQLFRHDPRCLCWEKVLR